MAQRRRRAEPGEIRLMLQRLPPVTRIADRRKQRRPQRRELSWFDHGDRRCHGDQHHGQGGQQPPRAPDPEPAQVQLPVPGPVGGEQVGDQVAAQDKKDINPEKPAVKRRELLMKGDNRKHGQRPDTIETGRPRSAAPAVLPRFSAAIHVRTLLPPGSSNVLFFATSGRQETHGG